MAPPDWSYEPPETAKQRKLLKRAGIAEDPNRTWREASALILQLVRNGELPPTCLSPATEAQRDLLARRGVTFPAEISKEEASMLIDKIDPDRVERIQEMHEVTLLSEKQAKYIRDLGGIPSPRMTMAQASKYLEYLIEREARCTKCGEVRNRLASRCDVCGAFQTRLRVLRPPDNIYRPTFWERVASFFIS